MPSKCKEIYLDGYFKSNVLKLSLPPKQDIIIDNVTSKKSNLKGKCKLTKSLDHLTPRAELVLRKSNSQNEEVKWHRSSKSFDNLFKASPTSQCGTPISRKTLSFENIYLTITTCEETTYIQSPKLLKPETLASAHFDEVSQPCFLTKLKDNNHDADKNNNTDVNTNCNNNNIGVSKSISINSNDDYSNANQNSSKEYIHQNSSPPVNPELNHYDLYDLHPIINQQSVANDDLSPCEFDVPPREVQTYTTQLNVALKNNLLPSVNNVISSYDIDVPDREVQRNATKLKASFKSNIKTSVNDDLSPYESDDNHEDVQKNASKLKVLPYNDLLPSEVNDDTSNDNLSQSDPRIFNSYDTNMFMNDNSNESDKENYFDQKFTSADANHLSDNDNFEIINACSNEGDNQNIFDHKTLFADVDKMTNNDDFEATNNRKENKESKIPDLDIIHDQYPEKVFSESLISSLGSILFLIFAAIIFYLINIFMDRKY